MNHRFRIFVPNNLSIRSPEWIFQNLVQDNHSRVCSIQMYLGDKPFLPTAEDLTPQPVTDFSPQVDEPLAVTQRAKLVAIITNFHLIDGQLFVDMEELEGTDLSSPNWEAKVEYVPRANNPRDCVCAIRLVCLGGDTLYTLAPEMLELIDHAA